MTRADLYDIAVIGGEPVEVINAAGVVDLIARSPLGVDAALVKLRGSMRPEVFAVIDAEVRRRLESS